MTKWPFKYLDRIGHWWQELHYNFHWEDYGYLFEGALPKLATAIPLAGYLVVFNDGIANYITFDVLTSSEHGWRVLAKNQVSGE